MGLDREAEALCAGQRGPGGKLFDRAVERVLVRLPGPVDSRKHRQARRVDPPGELEHVCEQGPRALPFGRIGVVGREALEVGPGDAEQIRDREPALGQAPGDTRRRPGNVVPHLLGTDVRPVPHEADVDGLDLEEADHLDRALPGLDEPERVVGAREPDHGREPIRL